MTVGVDNFAWIRRQLNDWYSKNHRDLPWRQSNDPYRIWISEIMLQQTQVATVVDYYHRFLRRFPDVQTLAAAPQEEILRYWEGLGYYRRALNLHLAAKQVVERHAGTFPGRLSELQDLAGIGRYTAGAIASFAFDARAPILETNTIRLLSRLFGWIQPIHTTTSVKYLWNASESLLPHRNGSGKVNQAMMELGSLICTPRQPLCTQCPLQKKCVAHSLGAEMEIPVGKPKLPTQSRTHWGLLVTNRQRRVLLRRNPDGQWWQGLWDLPWIEEKNEGNRPLRLRQLTRIQGAFCEELSLDCTIGPEHQSIQHAVTRYRVHYRVHTASLNGKLPRANGDWQWADTKELPPVVARFKRIKWQTD